MKLPLKLGHNGCAGDVPAMYKYRSTEITRRKHRRDMPEVTSNLVAGLGIVDVVRTNFDDTPILIQLKMMRRLLLRETHHMFPVGLHVGVLFLSLLLLCTNSADSSRHERDGKSEKSVASQLFIPF